VFLTHQPRLHPGLTTHKNIGTVNAQFSSITKLYFSNT